MATRQRLQCLVPYAAWTQRVATLQPLSPLVVALLLALSLAITEKVHVEEGVPGQGHLLKAGAWFAATPKVPCRCDADAKAEHATELLATPPFQADEQIPGMFDFAFPKT